MPSWDSQGREEWVCQKGGHICTGESTWVERGSAFAQRLGCSGNVCDECLKPNPQMSLEEHCRIESGGLTGLALRNYMRCHYVDDGVNV